jgi:hypothetical protein
VLVTWLLLTWSPRAATPGASAAAGQLARAWALEGSDAELASLAIAAGVWEAAAGGLAVWLLGGRWLLWVALWEVWLGSCMATASLCSAARGGAGASSAGSSARGGGGGGGGSGRDGTGTSFSAQHQVPGTAYPRIRYSDTAGEALSKQPPQPPQPPQPGEQRPPPQRAQWVAGLAGAAAVACQLVLPIAAGILPVVTAVV